MVELSISMEVREKMTTYKEVTFNIQTGQTTERPYTKEEIAQMEANAVRDAALAEVDAQKAAEKAAAQAKLAALGLTADDLKALGL